MNIAPDLEAKKHIVSNAVKVAHALGNPNPIVACLCAVEKVNPKMPATLDAAALVEANATGALPGCTVIGLLDNLVKYARRDRWGVPRRDQAEDQRPG